MAVETNSRVVLITGASRGIGACVANRLATDGWAVALNSHPDPTMLVAATEAADEIKLSGGRAVVLAADISSRSAVDSMFKACEDRLGTVDALVLNAAATGRSDWTDITEDEWDHVSAVNLKGAFLCCRRAFGEGPGRAGGSIVTIGSVLARVGAKNSLHYATTKAGIVGFSRSLARELGPRGVRVNCVIPGAIQTEEELEAFEDQEQVTREVLEAQIIGRRGIPDDIAGVISFLLSKDSDFITGQTITVDGGWVAV